MHDPDPMLAPGRSQLGPHAHADDDPDRGRRRGQARVRQGSGERGRRVAGCGFPFIPYSHLYLTPSLPSPLSSLPSPSPERNLKPSPAFFFSFLFHFLREQDEIERKTERCVTNGNIRNLTVSATDPLWIEIAQTGVQGPGGSGGTAPLLKGVTVDQLAAAGLEPPKPEPKPVLRYWTDGGVVGASKGGGSSSR